MSESTEEQKRILVVGATGSGKSTIVTRLADERGVMVLSVDPGNATFGPPCAFSLGSRVDGVWELVDSEPVGSLDALRFRAILLIAAARLIARHNVAELIIDAPGVHRGIGAAELIAGLVESLRITEILAVGEPSDALALATVPVQQVERPAGAAPGGDATRRKHRTKAWAAWLSEAADATPLARLAVFDHHPNVGLEGRVAVVRAADGPVGLGVVEAGIVKWRRNRAGAATAVTLRDATLADGSLRTLQRSQSPVAEPDEPEAMEFTLGGKPAIVTGLPMERVASARLSPVGDWFDDPMWLLRLDHRRRCLAFDLGEVRRLPTRIVHELTDVFVSHAHLDHVRDFLWLIRKRLGTPDALRLYGPPGFAERVVHMVEACTWDRVDDRGPRFEVAELAGTTLSWTAVQVGEGIPPEPMHAERLLDGVLLRDDRFVVRAIELDHHIPVLAFSVEESARFDVRGDVLRARGWKPGEWLGELKTLASSGQLDAEVDVPGVGPHAVRVLRDDLLLTRRPEKFVYATDLADHAENRTRLIEFARGADVFVCEAAFREHDRDQAERTGHLTARACGEIATAAEVRWLVPFHPSSRYHEDWRELLAEVQAACNCVVGGFRVRQRVASEG